MNPRLALLACCLVLLATLGTKAHPSASGPDAVSPAVPVGSAWHGLDCGGEPCDAVVRGLFAFFDRRLHGLDANGRSCADCHMVTDSFQLSPANAEARFQLPPVGSGDGIRGPTIRCSGRSTRMTSGPTASTRATTAISRQNGLVRVVFPLPAEHQAHRSCDQPTVERDVRRRLARGPDGQRREAHGPDDGENPWPRGPNDTGGYQLDARVTTLQEQALGALISHAEIQNAPPQRLLDDLASFQRVLFTNHRVRALSEAISEGTTPLPDPDPPLNELEQQGKAVFERACAIATAVPGSRTRRRRSSGSTTSRRSVRGPSTP